MPTRRTTTSRSRWPRAAPEPPRDPTREADLADLEPATTLAEDETFDRALLAGADLTGGRGTGSRFLECVLLDCDLTDADLSHARLADTVLHQVRGTGLDLSRAQLADVWVTQPRLGAAAAYDGSWRGVRVTGGKLDYLNLRGARLQDVWFEDVVLVEPDLAGATLTRVSFDGCVLTRPELSGARMSDVDLTGARLEQPQGLTSLRGATISRPQLIDLSDALAQQLGIRVQG